MNKLGTKTLKILLFIGVFSYLQYYDVKRGAFSVNSITGGLFAASAVYLIASLFGIVLSLTQNYLIAIVGTAALALFLAFKLDDLIASVSWLTEERMMYILGGFATLCFIRDIIIIKKTLSGASTTTTEEAQSTSEPNIDVNAGKPIKTIQEVCKENPKMMMELSKHLEKRNGHKPTYEELIEYIDNEAFHLLYDNQVEQETQAIIEQARNKARQQINGQ